MRDEDFAVTQAVITLPLWTNWTLLQNYLLSHHPPRSLSAASLRLRALLGKSWGCPCVKATCVIGPDPPGTLVPRTCDKHGGKAQDQVLQGAQRDRGRILFISQDVLIPRDSCGHRAVRSGLLPSVRTQLPALPLWCGEAGLGRTGHRKEPGILFCLLI